MKGGGRVNVERAQAGQRRPLRQALREFYLELRTTEMGPPKTAFAVFGGTVIGCLPIYGLHLAGCIFAARLFRLSATTTYLAAHINNPLTAPLIVASSLVLGRIVWPAPTGSEGLAENAVQVGRHLFVGAMVLGVSLGLVLAIITLVVSRRWSAPASIARLRARVAQRFLASGIAHWEFVRAKLRYDPLYFGLLDLPFVRTARSIVDLGCGRGILLSLFAEAGKGGQGAAVPRTLVGMERNKRAAFVAARALDSEAHICIADLSVAAVPTADVIVATDVLHYLPLDDQQSLLRRAVASLDPSGFLLVREADADGGWRFQATRIAERVRAIGRGSWRQSFHYRSVSELADFLRGLGLAIQVAPMSRGTPLANVLIVGSLAGRRQVDHVQS